MIFMVKDGGMAILLKAIPLMSLESHTKTLRSLLKFVTYFSEETSMVY